MVEAAIADAAPWLRHPAPEFSGLWGTALRDYAAALLAKRHRRLRKRLKDADLADRAAFHQLRIRVKKLRYPAELMRPLFDEDASSGYLKKARRVAGPDGARQRWACRRSIAPRLGGTRSGIADCGGLDRARDRTLRRALSQSRSAISPRRALLGHLTDRAGRGLTVIGALEPAHEPVLVVAFRPRLGCCR